MKRTVGKIKALSITVIAVVVRVSVGHVQQQRIIIPGQHSHRLLVSTEHETSDQSSEGSGSTLLHLQEQLQLQVGRVVLLQHQQLSLREQSVLQHLWSQSGVVNISAEEAEVVLDCLPVMKLHGLSYHPAKYLLQNMMISHDSLTLAASFEGRKFHSIRLDFTLYNLPLIFTSTRLSFSLNNFQSKDIKSPMFQLKSLVQHLFCEQEHCLQ